MQQQFKDLVVGAKFTYNGEAYTRIPDEPQTCCLTYNATKDNNNEKVMILPLEQVEVS